MAANTKGTVLTCTHPDCHCRVLIQEECHCPGVGEASSYRCACGAELVPVSEG
jgi:metallothionein